jgi:uracil-DNA glycosylase
MKFSLEEVHPSWRDFLASHVESINEILSGLNQSEITPERSLIFTAFQRPLHAVKVLIVGQDPYPTVGVANGLAFSVNPGAAIPASLRNIFKEYCDDLDLPTPTTGDLSPWSEQGVLLLNRVLTTVIGKRNAHQDSQWSAITEDLARYLGEREIVAILWGASAKTLAEYFNEPILSAHPSPLSAYRGFFGSQPFTKVNALLTSTGREPINWKLP